MRMRTLGIVVVAGLMGMTSVSQAQLHLMPMPAQITIDGGALALSSTFAVDVSGARTGRLTDAIDRAVARMEDATGLRTRVRARQARHACW